MSTAYEAKKIMKDRNYFGCMMVEMGDADAMISGLIKKLSGYHPAGYSDNRYRRRGTKDCRYVHDADQERSAVPGRYHGKL